MKIVRELGSGENSKEIKEIYERGNKIAISFNEDMPFSDFKTVLMDNGLTGEELNSVFRKGLSCVEGVKVFTGDLQFIKGELAIVDSIMDDKSGTLGVVKPFTDEDKKDFETTFCLYDNGVIADRVVEVEVE